MIEDDQDITNKNGNDVAKVLLIDLENCPNQIHQLQKNKLTGQ